MISLNYRDQRPIYEQVKDGLRHLVVTGAIQTGDKLPSVRALAREIGVNPNTVAKAYQELERQGIIYTVPGRGSFVSPDVLRLEGPKREALQEVFAACDRAVERGVTPPELLSEIERHLRKPSQGGNGHDENRKSDQTV